jgi:hypothetical protein
VIVIIIAAVAVIVIVIEPVIELVGVHVTETVDVFGPVVDRSDP